MPILRYADSSWADSRAGPEIKQLVAILRVRISPRPTPKRLRLVSTDARDVTDVTAWLTPLPFREIVFGHFGRGNILALTDWS